MFRPSPPAFLTIVPRRIPKSSLQQISPSASSKAPLYPSPFPSQAARHRAMLDAEELQELDEHAEPLDAAGAAEFTTSSTREGEATSATRVHYTSPKLLNPTNGPKEPSLAERLVHRMQTNQQSFPTNLRVVEYKPHKEMFWKVPRQERKELKTLLREG